MSNCVLKIGRPTLIVLIFNLAVFGQSAAGELSVRPEWKEYTLSPFNVGVQLPKFPVVDYSLDPCKSLERYSYVSYADDAVYTVNVTSSIKSGSGYCKRIVKFGPATLDERIESLIASMKLIREDAGPLDGARKVTLSNDNFKVFFLEDTEKNRFYEFWIASHKNRSVDPESFHRSLTTAPSKDSIDTKGGVMRTIGDDIQRSTNPSYWIGGKPEEVNYSFRIIHKPKARYTDAARQANEQGSVRLKVTLLASGGIGKITPDKGLKYGLTEQAIAAAQRIVFLPKKVDGVNVSVIATFEYHFSIY